MVDLHPHPGEFVGVVGISMTVQFLTGRLQSRAAMAVTH